MLKPNNYFKSNGQLYFFHDRTPSSIQDAWTIAGPTAVVWRMPRVLGPWRHAGIVGHRTEPEILADIRRCERGDPELEIAQLQDELSARRKARGDLF